MAYINWHLGSSYEYENFMDLTLSYTALIQAHQLLPFNHFCAR